MTVSEPTAFANGRRCASDGQTEKIASSESFAVPKLPPMVKKIDEGECYNAYATTRD